MNAMIQKPAYEDGIDSAKDQFEVLAGGHLNYGNEEIFAMQMLTKNDYVFKCANANPRSVQLAMINVASTGLTLNPAMGYAYLVPRDGGIVLDISFKGLIKIATDTGAIMWARAECVHESDQFTYHGPAAMPEIKADPFRERGEIIGAYCIAKTPEGDILTEVMDLDALHKVRSASTAFTKGSAGKQGPWGDYFSEMCRKAVIKRARKTWPYTDRNDRMATAVELANHAEGGYTFDAVELTDEEKIKAAEAARKVAHDAALDRHGESVQFIKDRLGEAALKDATQTEIDRAMTAAASEWLAIGEDDQRALWIATKKGGTFSTEERRVIKASLPRYYGGMPA